MACAGRQKTERAVVPDQCRPSSRRTIRWSAPTLTTPRWLCRDISIGSCTMASGVVSNNRPSDEQVPPEDLLADRR